MNMSLSEKIKGLENVSELDNNMRICIDDGRAILRSELDGTVATPRKMANRQKCKITCTKTADKKKSVKKNWSSPLLLERNIEKTARKTVDVADFATESVEYFPAATGEQTTADNSFILQLKSGGTLLKDIPASIDQRKPLDLRRTSSTSLSYLYEKNLKADDTSSTSIIRDIFDYTVLGTLAGFRHLFTQRPPIEEIPEVRESYVALENTPSCSTVYENVYYPSIYSSNVDLHPFACKHKSTNTVVPESANCVDFTQNYPSSITLISNSDISETSEKESDSVDGNVGLQFELQPTHLSDTYSCTPNATDLSNLGSHNRSKVTSRSARRFGQNDTGVNEETVDYGSGCVKDKDYKVSPAMNQLYGLMSSRNPTVASEMMLLGVVQEKISNLDRDIRDCRRMTRRTAADFARLHKESVKIADKVSHVKKRVTTTVNELEKIAYLDGLIDQLQMANANMVLKPIFLNNEATETAV